jgi:serine/threonine-protein kinase ATR
MLSRRRKDTSDRRADSMAEKLTLQAVRFYLDSLKHGSKFLFQSMPRLLTLWFEFMSDRPEDGDALKSSARSANARAAAAAASSSSSSRGALQPQQEMTALVSESLLSIPPHLWYTSLHQIMSRIGHPDETVSGIIIKALSIVAAHYPRQSVWALAQIFASFNPIRKRAGARVMKDVTTTLAMDGRDKDAESFANSKFFFADLIKLAQFQTQEKVCRFKLSQRVSFEEYIVPNRSTLTVTLPQSSKEHDVDPFPHQDLRITRFHEEVGVLHSKAKPKKVSLDTSGGTTVHYLLKQEKNGDLRKDARFMEFNDVINRVLQRDPAGRQRRLRLRTYSVVCLNEECGLLEWVPNTTAFRHLIAEAYAVHPTIVNPRFSSASVRDAFCKLQSANYSAAELGSRAASEVFSQFTPCFHRWFLDNFHEPTAWFEARTAFTRSAAVWSAVGHIVGLGDRHCENILIDTTTGECVHVDFDCLFDKGLTLLRPEVVPFRLTSHMIDAMGVSGYEGIFRAVMEVTPHARKEFFEGRGEARLLVLSTPVPLFSDLPWPPA